MAMTVGDDDGYDLGNAEDADREDFILIFKAVASVSSVTSVPENYRS